MEQAREIWLFLSRGITLPDAQTLWLCGQSQKKSHLAACSQAASMASCQPCAHIPQSAHSPCIFPECCSVSLTGSTERKLGQNRLRQPSCLSSDLPKRQFKRLDPVGVAGGFSQTRMAQRLQRDFLSHLHPTTSFSQNMRRGYSRKPHCPVRLHRKLS